MASLALPYRQTRGNMVAQSGTTAAAPAKDGVVNHYQLSVEESVTALQTDVEHGLSKGEVEARRAQYGPNVLAEAAKPPTWKAFLRQFQDFMQLLLIGAGVASVFIDQFVTAILLIVLALVNAVLGLWQENRAEASVAALKQMLQIHARVIRDGQVEAVDAGELVPGDVFLIEAGDQVPADGRIVTAATLEIEESALTGESVPTPKEVNAVVQTDAPLGDRVDMAYMNTLVTRGTGTVVVTSTGMSTEIGRIANMLDSVVTEKSPLQQRMDQLSKQLAVLAAIALAIVIIGGLLRGLSTEEVLLLGVAMAVAAIPTGLPTVVTTLLSMGTQQLAADNAVVKRLSSVETLGSVTAICSDKTGTLTLNKMTARALLIGGSRFSVTGEGYGPHGQIKYSAGEKPTSLDDVLVPMALCSDAVVHGEDLIGDPTEGALIVLAAKGGIDVEGTRDRYPRLAEVPFDAAYKLMATFHNVTDEQGNAVVRCHVKGAPDVIIGRSADVLWWDGSARPLDEPLRARALQENEKLAENGMRVMGVASRDFDAATFQPEAVNVDMVGGLRLAALVGIVDPPRPEARDAIAVAKGAGIRVRMITGDHAVTAAAIASELGLEGTAVTGADLDKMDDQSFAAALDDIGFVGRVAPEHKVRLVNALKARGEIVAMTGDGVNDAPALKSADIGVAMGITGTEVSKQAAVMVLTDDNFATIVNAVQRGRAIYDNLLKYLRFQMIALFGFLILFIGATLFNIAYGAPLTPLQVLYINFLVDVPLALALGMDKSAADLMRRKPREPNEPILTPAKAIEWGFYGLTMVIGALVVGSLVSGEFELNVPTASATAGFVTLGLAHIFAAFGCRSETDSVFTRDTLLNGAFLRRSAIAVAAMILVVGLEFLRNWFGIVPLTPGQWGGCLLGASAVLVVMELGKVVKRRRAEPQSA
jgi:Ca2+-transporting ATPase